MNQGTLAPQSPYGANHILKLLLAAVVLCRQTFWTDLNLSHAMTTGHSIVSITG